MRFSGFFGRYVPKNSGLRCYSFWAEADPGEPATGPEVLQFIRTVVNPLVLAQNTCMRWDPFVEPSRGDRFRPYYGYLEVDDGNMWFGLFNPLPTGGAPGGPSNFVPHVATWDEQFFSAGPDQWLMLALSYINVNFIMNDYRKFVTYCSLTMVIKDVIVENINNFKI